VAKLTPVFLARVEEGKLVFEQTHRVRRHVRSLEGKLVEVVIRRLRSLRSIQQNKYWHAVPVTIMSEYMGEDHMATHYALLGECFGYHWNEKLYKEIPNRGSSSALTVEDFSHLIEWCPPWALHEYSVEIPLPNECEWGAIPGRDEAE